MNSDSWHMVMLHIPRRGRAKLAFTAEYERLGVTLRAMVSRVAIANCMKANVNSHRANRDQTRKKSAHWMKRPIPDLPRISSEAGPGISSATTDQILSATQYPLVREEAFLSSQNVPEEHKSLAELASSVSMHGDLTATMVDESLQETAITTRKIPVPNYIQPLSSILDDDDIHFLWLKGALSTPETGFRNELVRSYIEHVHPSLPIIDLELFLRALENGAQNDSKISLVLFQAVMFAGTAFVDMSSIKNAGYSTRRDVRTALYQKARLLYDFDCENDRVVLLQSLLLLTHWVENVEDQKGSWHWIGVAISVAYELGIHRNLDNANINIKRRRLYKRLWWTCVIRDRLLSLGQRRPPRTDHKDYDVSMITLDDFEIHDPTATYIMLFPTSLFLRTVEMQRNMALGFIAKAKLCICVGHVLATQYTSLVRDHGMQQGPDGKGESRTLLVPKQDSNPDEVLFCDQELEHWYNKLPVPCHYTCPSNEELSSGQALIVERAILHMLYHSTISTLHRPRALPLQINTSPTARALQQYSFSKIREASTEITKTSIELDNHNLTRYLPITGVTVMLPAIITTLLDMNSSSTATREAGQRKLAHCINVLEQLRDAYAPADDAVQFLADALQRTSLNSTGSGQPGLTPRGRSASAETIAHEVERANTEYGNTPMGELVSSQHSQAFWEDDVAGELEQSMTGPEGAHPLLNFSPYTFSMGADAIDEDTDYYDTVDFDEYPDDLEFE
ncbi:hypothetical protein BP5796_05338 [Coleophoma crateriformis]|uniref:Xylanolytic transcriptional activator regulatory domain-containing protein n=1 Tax=Coleophoma crateriformis TaxID=565419 RepID=A0A3D8S399_9HELO|nr:hypothetical protein BP5796_05338 [Coleophoma crateriformis]